MNFNLIYDARCPKELKALLEPMFEQFAFVVPKWVEDVYVFFEDNQDEDCAVAETTTSMEYRRVFLRFFPDYLYERDDKLYQFVHELAHSIYGSVYHTSYSVVRTLLNDDPKFRDHVIEQLRLSNEGSNQDLTNMIFKMMNIDKRTGKKIKNDKRT